MNFNTANAQSTLGGSLVFNFAGETVTVTAFSTADKNTAQNSGKLLQTAYAGEYQSGGTSTSNYGLGVCTASQGPNCSSPTHQVDNATAYNFLLFKFSTPVSLSDVKIANYNNSGTVDEGVSYWVSSAASVALTGIDLTSAGLGGNGFGAQQNVSNSGTNGQLLTDSISGTNVTYLLLGSAYKGGDGNSNTDYFKVATIDATISAVPEPSTLVLLGSVVAALALASRRKTAKI